MQIDKGVLRNCLKPREKKYAKKLHKRAKRREGKLLNSSQYNRYSDGWLL